MKTGTTAKKRLMHKDNAHDKENAHGRWSAKKNRGIRSNNPNWAICCAKVNCLTRCEYENCSVQYI